MDGIKLPNTFSDIYNCSYTSTTSGQNIKVSLAALAKLMSDIPEPPKIYKMKIKLIKSGYLPKNSILISSDIVVAIEEAISNGR